MPEVSDDVEVHDGPDAGEGAETHDGPDASEGVGAHDCAGASGDAGAYDDGADVLLVEDNPGDVRLVEEAFRDADADAELHAVPDGRSALSFLRGRDGYADAPRPDVVLLDLNLPRIDGGEVLAELKTDPALQTIPVVVLTSSRAPEDVAAAYERGANAYLTKPVDPEAFIDTVRAFERFWLDVARLAEGA